MNAVILLCLFPVVSVLYLYRFQSLRDKAFPADSIGLWWLVYVNLYSTFPAFFWWLQDGQYDPVASQRLYRLQPSSDDMAALLSIVAAYSIAFTAAYLYMIRTSKRRIDCELALVSNGKFLCSGLLFLAVALFGAYQTQSVGIEAYYGEAFMQTASLSLGTRQLLKVVLGVGSVFSIVFLIGLLQRWPRYRAPMVIYLVALLASFSPIGSRGEMFTGVFTIFVLWHILRRPMSTKFWVTGGVVGLLLFILFGLIRGLVGQDFGALSILGGGLGEFDHIWANAVEVYQSKEQGQLELPLTIRFGEIWAFIPSQLIPIEKQALADWFLDVFYPEYKALGGGWVFGAIAQAAAGGGAFEAAIRGGLLGIVFGYAFSMYRKGTSKWWVFPAYIYLLTISFNTVRNTSFWFLTGFAQFLVPALIILSIGGALMKVNRTHLRRTQNGQISHSA